ncbi:hypothetical protein ABB37_08857 [Leptomonas pyrrhocoris]|uniref:Uncharacterized protein n=1 Tax=Leptomonas pyrrhocoris TaxID=157538 RepID=A0A0N0DRR2_LEPPY|nr:hypothetical protein ABB37_08857 [Leptomonas pyrrhocoris]KPA74834.1 hypothetical protein ABB37_08857 [Leptomonas pyrrhocoris]|eukprot:XP_015653273.1 hypothetical protein ABB37_08857 [Leptomonas pyrrhocoris]
MLRWSASLPSPVRLQLLINETARIERCRRFIADGLRSEHRRRRTAVSEAAVADADGDSAATAAAAVQTRVSLSNTWRQSVLEARAVVRCCAAPWLVGEERNADAHSNTVEANGKEGSGCSSSREQLTPTATAALLTAAERGVMLACLRLAAACHGEDVGQHLMDIFINSVDVVVRGAGTVSSLHYRREEESQRNVEAFQAWYEADGAEVYEAAMTCVARECTRPTSPSSSSSSVPLRRDGHSSRVHGSGGFARAYAFFVHRAATTALLSHQDDSDASDVGRAPSAQARSSGSAWTTSLTHYPVVTMQLLKPLADCVDANAEHFNMVVQLYGRMLSETEVGYSAEDGGTAVRRAFAALLLALARVPLGSRSKMECLEDLYRRTLLNSSLEVVQHPDVLAGCLRVCGAARAANRSIALFNKLAEPSSRSLALQEENMAAVCLAQAGDSTSAPAAVLQRLLCFMQTRLPLTADVVQAAVATTLLSRAVDTNTTAATPPMTSAFAMLDLLTSGAVAQHRVTRSTAAVNAERTFFLRVVLLLTGASVTQDEPNSGAASSLHTPAAAAIFQQWVGEFAAVLGVSTTDEHGRRCTGQAVAKVAPSLSVVTVGALQELWVVLRRADCLVPSLTNSDEGNGRFAASATPSSSQEQDQPRQQPSPLAQAVRDMLAAIPPPVATSPWCKTLSVWPFSPSPSTAASAPSSCTPPLLVTLPPSFQWRQLMEVWPLAEQQRFMESFVKLFTVASPAMSGSPHPHSGEETAVCMRYHDYMLLEEVFGKTSAATEWADAARVWNTKGERTAASLQEAIAARLAGIPTATPVRALHVLSPLADVEGALQWSGAAAAATTAEASPPPPTVPLPQLLGVPVPPVPGCPVHSWAVDVHRGAADHKGDHARPRKVLLAVYWLTRWVDSVEDAALLPSPSLFRQAVIAAIDHSHLSEAPVQEAVHTTVSDAKEETGGENNAAAHDEEMKVNAKRGGIEEVLVRGPTSLLYDAAS